MGVRDISIKPITIDAVISTVKTPRAKGSHKRKLPELNCRSEKGDPIKDDKLFWKNFNIK